jgi:hypothetical protein
MLGAFLIPIGTSSLRGLTHVLACERAAKTPFTVVLEEGEIPIILSSSGLITPEGEEEDQKLLCGALQLDLGVSEAGPESVNVHVPITNLGKFEWRGTVRLKAGKLTLPVDIGAIKPGVTETETLEVKLPDGETQLNGTLLLGP